MLKVRDLGVNYGALVALDAVNWDVASGQVLGIIGPNGAGKSSCFDAVTAMTCRRGTVSLAGEDVTHVEPYKLAARGLKRAFQQNAFFTQLTVLENLLVVLGERAYPGLAGAIFSPAAAARRLSHAREFAAAQLERFAIASRYHHLTPADIPYGVQRMLSIALAYGSGAKALLLDEPAAGLGGADMERLEQVLHDLKEEGVALVMIEHHMDLVMNVADEIVVLDLGRTIAKGTPQAIQADTRVLDAYLGIAA